MDLATTALVSGLFAAIVAIAVSTAIEKLGGTVGGVLATLPTTIIPASLGIASRLDNDGLTRSMFTVPCGMLVSAVFLMQWRIWPRRLPAHWSLYTRLTAMLSISLGIWLALATVVVAIEQQVLVTTPKLIAFGTACYFLIAAAGLAFSFRPIEAPKGGNKVGWRMILARGVMAGLAIVVTILLASLSGVMAGVAASFPAIFSTIMVGVWLAQGSAVSAGAVAPMVLGGLSPPTYALLFAALAEPLGPAGAACVSWIVAACFVSVPVALFLKWRKRIADKNPKTNRPHGSGPATAADEEGAASTAGAAASSSASSGDQEAATDAAAWDGASSGVTFLSNNNSSKASSSSGAAAASAGAAVPNSATKLMDRDGDKDRTRLVDAGALTEADLTSLHVGEEPKPAARVTAHGEVEAEALGFGDEHDHDAAHVLEWK